MILDVPVKCGTCGRPLTGLTVDGVFIMELCRVCLRAHTNKCVHRAMKKVRALTEKGGED